MAAARSQYALPRAWKLAAMAEARDELAKAKASDEAEALSRQTYERGHRSILSEAGYQHKGTLQKKLEATQNEKNYQWGALQNTSQALQRYVSFSFMSATDGSIPTDTYVQRKAEA